MLANTGYIPLPNTSVSVCIRNVTIEGAPFAGSRYGILYSLRCSLTFSRPDGIRDASGNLYGTTTFGGANLGSGQGAGTTRLQPARTDSFPKLD
jgi:hypothetical protein